MKPFTTTLAYPRIGRGRPYKRMRENFWPDKIEILERLPIEQVWVHPDGGLKTRGYAELLPALRNLAAAAQQVRETLERK